MSLDMAETEAYVAKGLEWLKTVGVKHGLDHARINIHTLRMQDMGLCALTQAAGPMESNYVDLRHRLVQEGAIPYASKWRVWDGEHGFWSTCDLRISLGETDDRTSEEITEEYAMLTLAWIRALCHDAQWVAVRSTRSFVVA